ncbi:MAG TPA: COX15/CtaA family protein [Gaiellaceae bacterium]|nr:COX15/CtaA family protein [Gaiellaceae bacterium]
MESSAHPLARARELVLSPTGLRRLAIANAAMLIVIMATGATVRLTGSGLGCEHWPGCAAHHFEPKSFHSYVEFGNRVVAFITICVTLATWLGAIAARAPKYMRRLAIVTFVGTLAQAPLGAITIHYDLNPWLVLSHFLLSIVVLTLGVVLAVEASRLARGTATREPAWTRAGSVVVAVSAAVLLFSGMLATASGKYPGSSGSTIVRRLWSFEGVVYWHVRATAVFGVTFALLLIWLARTHNRHVRAALVVLALLAVQMTVGEVQYRTELPWWLVLIHVTLAATVWAAVVAFVYRLWRPPASTVA